MFFSVIQTLVHFSVNFEWCETDRIDCICWRQLLNQRR